MKRLLFLLALTSCGAFGADPFLMFVAVQDPSTYPVLEKYVRSTDYLAARIIRADPGLQGSVSREHQIDLDASLARVQASVHTGCGAASAGTIVYQWKAASPTTAVEQADPVGSVAQAVASIHATGCDHAGVALGPELFGFTAGECGYNLDLAKYRQVDWREIDFLNIEGHGLLKESCAGKSGIADYVKLAAAVASYVRSQNPRIVIAAQLSFRFTPPQMMIEAARAMSGVVDGFLLAYPLNPEHERKYSDARDLATVLGALRPAGRL